MKRKKTQVVLVKENRDKYLDSMVNMEKNLVGILERMIDNEIAMLGGLKRILGYAKSILEEIDDDKLKEKDEKPVIEIGVDSNSIEETE